MLIDWLNMTVIVLGHKTQKQMKKIKTFLTYDLQANAESGEPSPLQRVFKVVIIGDSGVGKSSFIHRFCHNKFRASYQATIGKLQIRACKLQCTSTLQQQN